MLLNSVLAKFQPLFYKKENKFVQLLEKLKNKIKNSDKLPPTARRIFNSGFTFFKLVVFSYIPYLYINKNLSTLNIIK